MGATTGGCDDRDRGAEMGNVRTGAAAGDNVRSARAPDSSMPGNRLLCLWLLCEREPQQKTQQIGVQLTVAVL